MTNALPCSDADEAQALFHDFRADIRAKLAQGTLAQSIIGKGRVINGPVGPQPLLYADYAASGRALREIEEFVLEHVLPVYANPHTQASWCGRSINALRRVARAEVAKFCGAGADDAVIFAGSGATAGLQKLVRLFGVDQRGPSGERALVLLGPYEHHSNLLPWRESGAEVIELPEDSAGGPDRVALAAHLERGADRRIVAAFSAGSNVTGALTEIADVSRMVQAAGGKVIWDYAGAASYITMQMQPAPDVHVDALVFSPHKFVGGPASSGVLVLRRDAEVLDKPSAPGGGTVSFVSPGGHDYLADLAAREEAGTPNVIGDIRTALACIVRAEMSEAGLDTRAASMCREALDRWRANSRIEVLGRDMDEHLPIVSFRMRDGEGKLVHHQLVTRIMSDCFGIQARGGCACAGPYVHRLLAIDEAQSQAIHQAIRHGAELDKPGFVRVNFSPLMDDAELETLIACVEQVAEDSESLARHFTANPATAVFEPVAA
ncbi:aminotransferase class V-fold PLP-dependent enzyme [Sphingosinicella microcystinivorans]|uniref:Selenocysteine lyase/cysteine desulfurase n=1 Tax=Sphingosinicella microcystinivorans TaxID=335406 RepID=A0ABX9SZA7_SPHMI|nr:aminotransferase class V-fold PLP-dependent enzyme [Sphingosinicella microcystinivorans]RKS89283.1 selenocysteine lyase/cysteine desulfurase [Sphingosinicella microcystinivorans]